jgi:hypothetical protein
MLDATRTNEPDQQLDGASRTSWVIDVAARYARKRGVAVKVLLPRAPGVVSAIREAAAECGVGVETTISPGIVSARFDV